MLASAILGAKLLLVLVEWKRYVANPKDLIEVVRSGGVFYGGLICTTVVSIWYMKKNGLPAWRIADMGAPSIALGEAMGRWGCFAAGCCYGKESHGPFAVTFSDPFAHEAVGTPLGVPLHPDADLPVAQRVSDLPRPPVGLPPEDLRRRSLLALRAALRDHARDPRDMARRLSCAVS